MAYTQHDKNDEVMSVLRQLHTEETVEKETGISPGEIRERDIQRAQLKELRTIAIGITKMANVKTAISIQQSLFEQAEVVTKEMKISRSRLFGLAVEDFIHRYQNRLLLDEINRTYADEPDTAEQERLDSTRHLHRSLVEGEW